MEQADSSHVHTTQFIRFPSLIRSPKAPARPYRLATLVNCVEIEILRASESKSCEEASRSRTQVQKNRPNAIRICKPICGIKRKHIDNEGDDLGNLPIPIGSRLPAAAFKTRPLSKYNQTNYLSSKPVNVLSILS